MTGDLPSPIAEQAVDSGFTFQKPVDADIRKDDNKKPQAGFSGWPETTADDGSSILGGARHGEPQPSLSFSFEPTPPVSPPPSSPAEKPQHHSAPEAKKPVETGNTTVLIRYTCPKCKTQGMQEVDKVGAVVNCSNCGKAMRLVMKK
ncbi:MAG: hypothetical protein LBE84_03040 [Planctomycetota bacterium]|nr:hypothetical protein [Planctomycetota bacterium]